MTSLSDRAGNVPHYGTARAVTIAVGLALILYGMKRRSWIGRLTASAGTGLIARSVGAEGSLASVWAYVQHRFPGFGTKGLQAPR